MGSKSDVYMSDSNSDDEDFIATSADLAAAAEAAALPEEHNSEASSDEAEEVGLALTSDMLPTNTTIQCLNTKTSWGREATTVSSRRCKISAAHCPAGCKVAVCLIDDLLPTSGGFQLDTEALWTTASRGGSVDRYLLVAMELNDGPENAEWRLWQFPMATDQRLVREIVAESGTELTDDLKKKLVVASDPANRSLDKLPSAVAAAFQKYGGLVYSSATYQKMKPRQPSSAATSAAPQSATKLAFKKPAVPPSSSVVGGGAAVPPKKRKNAVLTPAAVVVDDSPSDPEPTPPKPAAVVAVQETPVAKRQRTGLKVGSKDTAEQAVAQPPFTLTLTATDPAMIAKLLAAAQAPA
jgi:hypothetical protein